MRRKLLFQYCRSHTFAVNTPAPDVMSCKAPTGPAGLPGLRSHQPSDLQAGRVDVNPDCPASRFLHRGGNLVIYVAYVNGVLLRSTEPLCNMVSAPRRFNV